jgi:nitroreductase
MNETIKAILNRRSIRKYKSEQIGDTELQAIMEAAVHAPSAMNQQKWHFTVVQNPAVLARLAAAINEGLLKSRIPFMVERAKSPGFNVFHHAPTVILIMADKKAHFTDFDCGAAAENIAVSAASLGIGSCIIGLAGVLFESAEAEKYKEELGIPEGYRFVVTIALGYSDTEKPPVPPKNRDVINYIK